jgi:hypothetical protein
MRRILLFIDLVCFPGAAVGHPTTAGDSNDHRSSGQITPASQESQSQRFHRLIYFKGTRRQQFCEAAVWQLAAAVLFSAYLYSG